MVYLFFIIESFHTMLTQSPVLKCVYLARFLKNPKYFKEIIFLFGIKFSKHLFDYTCILTEEKAYDTLYKVCTQNMCRTLLIIPF